MLIHFLGSIVEIAIALGFIVLVYQVFVSDWVDEKREWLNEKNQKLKYKQTQISNFEKIARIKLVSNNAKEIEKFINDNAEYLSDNMVQQLVSRIELINNDQIINADNMLKTRIDALDSLEDEEPSVVKRASRKK